MTNGNGTAKWSLSLNAIGVAFSIAVVVVGFLIQIARMSAEQTALSEKIEAIGARVTRLEDRSSINREDIAGLKASLVEVETQFHSSDQAANLRQASNMAITAQIYRRVYGVDYPSFAFYPTIARPDSRAIAR